LELLSQVVLQLHRGSREWPVAVFAPRACELLNSLMHFDACHGWFSCGSSRGLGLLQAGLSNGPLNCKQGLHQGAWQALSRSDSPA